MDKMAKTITLKFDGYYTEKQLPPSHHDGSGIYVVYRGNSEKLIELLYIGRSNEIDARPGPNHENYQDWHNQLKSGEILYFSFADTDNEERAEAALIFKVQPRCNSLGKSGFHYQETTVNTSGENAGLPASFTVQKTG
jgi:hypothetical protein